MGPLLFPIYVYDISQSTPENILSFADDTTLIISDSDQSNLYFRANRALQELFDWFCANKLSLNAKKTQYMVIKPGCGDHSQTDLKINDVILTHMDHCKFLGITIDENLTWKCHLSNVNKKISNALFTIKQLKFSLPIESLHTLYFSLIHSHLSYGILAWGNATSSVLRKTETIQKRAIRTIHNKKFNSHTDPLFKRSRILRISDIYKLEVMLFMYDFINDSLPQSFRHTFSLVSGNHTYDTRQNYLFNLPRTKSRSVDKLPLYHYPSVWNQNAAYINCQVSRYCFRRSFKASQLAKYQDRVECNNKLCHDCSN